jgi:hypothetical protein
MLRVCVGLGGKCFLGCVGWVVVINGGWLLAGEFFFIL